MFAVMHNPKAAYSKAGIETGVDTADPHKLILMPSEGAMLAVAPASLHKQSRDGAQDIARTGEPIPKAITIINNGHKASPDLEVRGQLAGKLGEPSYSMSPRLLHAKRHDQPAVLDEVSHLLAELKGAWEQIGNNKP